MGTHGNGHPDTREVTLNIEINAADELTQALLSAIDEWQRRGLSIDPDSTGGTPQASGTTHRIELIGHSEQFINLVQRPEAVEAGGGARDAMSA